MRILLKTFLLLAITVTSVRADAAGLYLEPSVGAGSQLLGLNGLGFDADLGVFLALEGRDSLFEIQLGLHDWLNNSFQNGTYYEMNAFYPELRLQFGFLFAGAGVTPFLWSRAQPNPGLGQLAITDGQLGVLGEAGILWPVIPTFSLGLKAAVNDVLNAAAIYPNPAMSAMFFMRFYFAFAAPAKYESTEFKGWRYPFGIEEH